jgi:predicted enzyme related to lactoylglutathione lyase
MSEAFAWFHHDSDKRNDAQAFYEELLGWGAIEGPGGMRMFAGEKGPFAGFGDKYTDHAGWIPFVQIPDLDTATDRAKKLGATILKDRSPGPAGRFSVLRDPSGATFALWQKA